MDTKKPIMAILQNQWFRNPDKVRAILARHAGDHDRQSELRARYLFAGCHTGRRLKEAFGDLCDRIWWEEASPLIGGVSSSKFPADPQHIHDAIVRRRPQIVLALGRVAQDALRGALPLFQGGTGFVMMFGPHPAARAFSTRDELDRLARSVRERLEIERAWRCGIPTAS